MARVASIGECMIELKQAEGGLFSRGYGGDTLNTAIHLARAGRRDQGQVVDQGLLLQVAEGDVLEPDPERAGAPPPPRSRRRDWGPAAGSPRRCGTRRRRGDARAGAPR